MGSLDRNTVAKALQEVQVPDRDCRRCWWQFYCMIDSQYVSLPTFFYFNKIVWLSAVMCHLKKKKTKIPDLSLPPCIFLFISPLPPDASIAVRPLWVQMRRRQGAYGPMLSAFFNTYISTNSVLVSPLKTDAPFFGTKRRNRVFLRFKSWEYIPLSVPK